MMTVIIVCQGITNATNTSALFDIFGVDNTPLKSSYTVSMIRCALACHVSSECKGFNYSSQVYETHKNCFMYYWLTPGGEDEEVFATRSPENATVALILGEHSHIYFAQNN